jgi:hypothetical protein
MSHALPPASIAAEYEDWLGALAIRGDQNLRPREIGEARIMSELLNRSSGNSATTVQIIPPDIVSCRITARGGIRAELIEVIRRDQFEYKFHAPHLLLIMSERASRDHGERLVDGLPTSTARNFSRKLILVPAGHETRQSNQETGHGA